MRFQLLKEFQQALQLFRLKSCKKRIYSPGATDQGPKNERAPFWCKIDATNAQIGFGSSSFEETLPLESINRAGYTRRLDEEARPNVFEAEFRLPAQLSPVKNAENSPLRTADAKAGEVRLHDPMHQAVGSKQ